jgi:hypothetical protein
MFSVQFPDKTLLTCSFLGVVGDPSHRSTPTSKIRPSYHQNTVLNGEFALKVLFQYRSVVTPVVLSMYDMYG